MMEPNEKEEAESKELSELAEEFSQSSPVLHHGEPVEIQALTKLINGMVEPIARSQEVAQVEETKRLEMSVSLARSLVRYQFAIAAVFMAVSVIAMLLDKDQIAEKIIFGVLGFLGGIFVGKNSKSE